MDSGRFPWDNGNFPVMTEPVATYGNLRFWDNFGEYGFATKLRVEGLRNLGGVLSPFNAFLILQGMETLPLRMEAHVANAQKVAEWLDLDPRVSWVRYAGLPDDPNHALARKYLPKGPGAVFSFGCEGGREAGEAFIGRVELCSHLANVGDTRTLVIHPGSHDPPPALDRGARGRGRAARARAHQRRHRGRRRHPLRPRPGARMSWEPPTAGQRLKILRRAKTIAVVGASANPARASNFVLTYLLSSSADYEVWPVTPNETEILGAQVLPVARRAAGQARHRRRLPPRRPAPAGRARGGRGRRGRVLDAARAAQRRGGRDRVLRRPGRRLQPLREDRARALPRRPAPRGLRHRRHLLAAHPWLKRSFSRTV